MELSITATKMDSKSADINFNTDSQLAKQMEALRSMAESEPMTKETAILLNMIIEMVSEQRTVASSVIPQNLLPMKIRSIKSKMILINKISRAVKEMLN